MTTIRYIYLCFNDFASSGLENFALASSTFNGRTSGSSERVGLNSDVLGSKVSLADNNLVDVELGLGDGIGFQKGFDCRSRFIIAIKGTRKGKECNR